MQTESPTPTSPFRVNTNSASQTTSSPTLCLQNDLLSTPPHLLIDEDKLNHTKTAEMRKNLKIPMSYSKPCTDNKNQSQHQPQTEKHGTPKTQTQSQQQHQALSALLAAGL